MPQHACLVNYVTAGDTAQCISRDNTFCFADIKTRFYEHFISLAKESGKPGCAKAELIKLPKNYRSHQGILSLAADIVDMLCNGKIVGQGYFTDW